MTQTDALPVTFHAFSMVTERNAGKLQTRLLLNPKTPSTSAKNSAARAPLWRLLSLCTLMFWLGLCVAAEAEQSVSIAWNPAASSDVKGYAVYYGASSHNYSHRMDVGTNTVTLLSGLKPGNTNFFAVTSYDAAGLESTPSTEVVYLVPGMVRFMPSTQVGELQTVQFPVAPGHWYEVQASTDMRHWGTIYRTPTVTSNVWMGFQDPKSKAITSRYYRVVLH